MHEEIKMRVAALHLDAVMPGTSGNEDICKRSGLASFAAA